MYERAFDPWQGISPVPPALWLDVVERRTHVLRRLGRSSEAVALLDGSDTRQAAAAAGPTAELDLHLVRGETVADLREPTPVGGLPRIARVA
jgi:hypothetical protein